MHRAGRPLIEQPEGGNGSYPRGEKLASGLAHAGTLIFGVPLAFFLLPAPLAFAICPAISYFISRRFRRRQRNWGAFQALQAAVIQLVILALVFLTVTAGLPYRLELTFGTVWFLLLLYSLWGAVDALMGYDFRYIFIGDFVEKVSHTNMSRIDRSNANRPPQGQS